MSVENPEVPLSEAFEDTDTFDLLTGGGGKTVAGVRVSRSRVLGYSAVWRAINLISSAVGRLPIEVYRWIEPKAGTVTGRAVDYDHAARRVLRRPNECMTPITFRKTLQSHALTEGNGYAYIVRDLDGVKPTELVILDPRATWPVIVNGDRWYVSECGEPVKGRRRRRGMVRIPAADMIHIQGLGSDGLCGYSVFRLLKETFGGALASRDFGARYFKNDSRPGIALVVPQGMKDPAITTLRESWERLHKGIDNAHRAAILRDGVTIETFGAAARDAQLMENRAFDTREIANVFGVPAHKLGDASRTAYNSLESENQGWLDDTLDDWLTTWEQELGLKLLTEFQKEAESHVIEFKRRALLRTNLSARGTYYTQALQGGWHNPDEIREEEGYNPIPGGAGQTFTRPVNVTPATTPTDPPADPAADPNTPPAEGGTEQTAPPADPPAADPARSVVAGLLDAFRGVAADSLARMVRRVGTGAERAASRPAALSRYFSHDCTEHRDVIAEAVKPFVDAARFAGRQTREPNEIADAVLGDLAEAIRPKIGRAADLPAAVREAVAAVASSTPARIAGDLFPES